MPSNKNRNNKKNGAAKPEENNKEDEAEDAVDQDVAPAAPAPAAPAAGAHPLLFQAPADAAAPAEAMSSPSDSTLAAAPEAAPAEAAEQAAADQAEAERVVAEKDAADRAAAEQAAADQAAAEQAEAQLAAAAKAALQQAAAEQAAADQAKAERAAAEKAATEQAAADQAPRTSVTSNAGESAPPLEAAQKRLLELLPGVKDVSVLQALAELADSDALERLVQKGKPPPKASFVARTSVKNSIFAANDSMQKKNDSQQVAKSQSKNYGTVDNKALAVGGAGQGGGLGLNRPGSGPSVQHFAGRASIGGAKTITIDEDVSFAWSEMQDDKSSVGFVIASYSDDGKTLKLKEKGEGGLAPFKAGLPDAIAWGGFRCYGVDKRGGLECKRPKFVFVQYKPESASAIKKAKTASHKGDVKEAFTGAHMDVTVESMEDLAEQNLITKLQAATGAHKPNGYEFDEGVFCEADFYGLGIGKNCRNESSKN